MSQPKWITPAGNLGIVPSLEYYQFTLDAYDAAGGTLVYTRVSGRLPPGIQVVNTGKLQGIPVSEAGPDANTTYTFTIRATNSSTGSVTDRTFTLTITNVSPPIIVPKDVDLGVFFDGDIVDIQFEALEFIVEDNLTWSVVDGEIPEGLSLSQSGQLTGYIKQIRPNPWDPASDPGWSDTPWDLLGWEFPEGAVQKEFKFTLQVSDGANVDHSSYVLMVYPRNGLRADSTLISINTTSISVDLQPKHNPIIISTQTDLVAERQGSYFSFKVEAIDLDGDTLEYSMPAVSTGAFDEQQRQIPPVIVNYINEVVTDGNLYSATTSVNSPNLPALTAGDTVQVLYSPSPTGGKRWYYANVNNYTTVRITGNTIVTGAVGAYITQSVSSANAVISNISATTGTISFEGNSSQLLTIANGDYITQGSANARVISAINPDYGPDNGVIATFLTGTFTVGSGNISVNGNSIQAYPSEVICNTDIGAVYTDSNVFRLNWTTIGGEAYINGTDTGAIPTAIVSVGVTIGGTTEQGTVGFDESKYDQGVLILPLLLPEGVTSVIDNESGWIVGTLPGTTANETNYEFEITVKKADDPAYSASRLFTLTVLGDLNNTVTWLTPSNLGTIENGKVSDLFVKAISSKGKVLQYTYTEDAFLRLPQGLSLSSNGLITGRVSFEVFSLDQATTTLDGRSTTFDDTYRFSVTATDYDNTTSATRIFTIRVIERNTTPYENLYLKALLSSQQREYLLSIMRDQTVFPLDLIYRHEDPYYGVATNLKALFLAGISPSTLEEYALAADLNHYTKRITLGPVKTAVARSNSYDVVEIASGNVIGTFEDEIGFIPSDFTLGYSASIELPEDTVLGEEHIKYEVVYAEIIDSNTNALGESPASSIDLSSSITTPYYDASGNSYDIAYPNSFTNMETRIVTLGYANKGALPDWMTTLQPDGSILGFKRAVVLAYTQPGAGEAIAWRFNQQGYNINEFDFTVDRYQLDNIYSENYDIAANAFIASTETTFDRYPPTSSLFNVIGTVDYAVNLSFDSINQRSVADIISTGALDSMSNFSDGDTLVFFKQEFATGIGNTYNQGWNEVQTLWARNSDTSDADNTDPTLDSTPGLAWDSDAWDASSYVPGFNEHNLDPLTANKRIGIWRINIVQGNTPSINENLVTLTFVQTLEYFDTVYVRRGYTHGGTNIYFNPKPKPGNLVPNFSIIPQQVDIVSTSFDGNGTRFLSNRDEYTVPEAGDKYIKFANTGVFT